MKILGFILGSAILLSACNQGAPSVDTSLGKANSEKFESMLNAGDVDGLVSLYTKDARVMPPNGMTKRGEAAVREEFGAMIAAGITGDLTSLESKAVGDVAYNLGTYELTVDGETIDKGKWIETWQRGTDGMWRISNDIWNSDNPAMPPEKPAMTYIMGTHKVGSAATWLAAWSGADGRRKDFAAHGAPHVHVMQSSDDPSLTGLVIGMDDPAAFDAWLNSDAGKAAAAEDSVDMSTMKLFVEIK